MTESPQRRRWFRFSLRTFLLAFTAVAVWLGWNVWLVNKRDATLWRLYRESSWAKHRDLEETPRHILAQQRELEWLRTRHNLEYPPTARPRLSKLRQWLGDQLELYIEYQPSPEISLETVRWLYPEATIFVRQIER